MDGLWGPLAVAAAIPILAGASKLRDPAPVRRPLDALGVPAGRSAAALVGGVELAVGGAALVAPSPPVAGALALLYLLLAAAALRLRGAASPAPCGCFGDGASATLLHVWIDGLAATLVLTAAVVGGRLGIAALAVTSPLEQALAVVAVACGAILTRAVLTSVPPLWSAYTREAGT
jgi:uncharacterized membrane protein YphA (DoxX/SURF4 family)